MEVNTQLKQLEAFIQQAQSQLKQNTQTFDKEALKRTRAQTGKLFCPFNPGHLVPRTIFSRHCWECEQKQLGCHKVEQESTSNRWFYKTAPKVVTILRKGNALVAADGTTRMSILLDQMSPQNQNVNLDRKLSDEYFSAIPRCAIPSGLIRGWLLNRWLMFTPQIQLKPQDAMNLACQLDRMINYEGCNATQVDNYLESTLHSETCSIVYELWDFMHLLLSNIKASEDKAQQLLDTPSSNTVCIDHYYPVAPVIVSILHMQNHMQSQQQSETPIARQLQDMHDTSASHNSSEQSFLQKMVEERDYKRRRRSYRAKNVHTTKKTQTQIYRDTIDTLMQELIAEERE
ncbi:hypothetical protein BDF19DRAFT_441049 [Syncephalis fuscata]|nr:hypothetical protein BDF19DRAFT_441049 [Syncephalis fuscata]